MDAALVGERRAPDVRLVVVRRDVRDLGDGPRQLREGAQLAAARRQQLVLGLEREAGEDADHVRVAAALAVAVDRRLDVANARLHGGEGVRDRELGVVVGVDAQREAVRRLRRRRRAPPRVSARIVSSSPGERAAVGVAQDERPRAAVARGPKRRERVVAVGLVAVEEVLGVVDELAALARR